MSSITNLTNKIGKANIGLAPLMDGENIIEIKAWLVKLGKFAYPNYDRIILAVQDEWEKINAVDLPDYSSGESLYLDASEEILLDPIETEIEKAKIEIEEGRFVMGSARLMKLLPVSIKARFLLGLFMINDEDDTKRSRGFILLLVGIQQGLTKTLNNKEKRIAIEAIEKIKEFIFAKHNANVTESMSKVSDIFNKVN